MSAIVNQNTGQSLSVEVDGLQVLENIRENLDVFTQEDVYDQLMLDGTVMDHEPARKVVLEALGIAEGSEEADNLQSASLIYLYC